MIDTRKLRFGIIGAGAIAQTHAQALQESNSAEAVAIADIRPAAAQAMAEMLNCEAFENYEEMADRVSLDVCVVCTPPATHEEICTRLAGRGIHILCEKPLAIDSASARRMIETAQAAGVILMMASKFRYVQDVVQAKAIVTSGVIGKVVFFENSFTSHVDMSARWNSESSVSGGGVLIDNGTHSVDVMRYFLGPLAELQVMEGERIQSLPVEDTVLMFARSTDGVMGSIDLSWSINKGQPYYLGIHGSNGTLLVGWQESKYRRPSDRDWVVFGQGYDKVQAFQSQIENLCLAIQGREAQIVTVDDALASVLVVEAAYDAMRRNTWQPIEHPFADAAQDANSPSVG